MYVSEPAEENRLCSISAAGWKPTAGNDSSVRDGTVAFADAVGIGDCVTCTVRPSPASHTTAKPASPHSTAPISIDVAETPFGGTTNS